MERASSFDGPPLRHYCEDCTVARLGAAMTLRCNKPVRGGYCRSPMGHDGDHDPGLAR